MVGKPQTSTASLWRGYVAGAASEEWDTLRPACLDRFAPHESRPGQVWIALNFRAGGSLPFEPHTDIHPMPTWPRMVHEVSILLLFFSSCPFPPLTSLIRSLITRGEKGILRQRGAFGPRVLAIVCELVQVPLWI